MILFGSDTLYQARYLVRPVDNRNYDPMDKYPIGVFLINSVRCKLVDQDSLNLNQLFMKSTFILMVIATTIFAACGDSKPKDIQADPRSVAEAIFDAAKTGNYANLASLIDTDADNDSKMIAQVATDQAIQEEFKKYFAKGKVSGEPTVNGDKASVNILFGPDGAKEETFEMVKKNDKWYLVSF